MTRIRNELIPDDPDIPALSAASDRGLGSVLATAGIVDRVADFQLLKHHPGSRCTFMVRAGGRRVLLKAYADDPASLIELFQSFEREGLATGLPPTVAPLLAFDRQLRFLVNGWFERPAVSEHVDKGAGPRAGELAAAWLEATSALAIGLGQTYGPEAMLVDAARWARSLARAGPDLGSAASARVDELAADPPAEPRYTLRHGSFSISHVLDLGEGPGVIDWDTFRQGAFELDAGFFLAALSRFSGGRRRLAGETALAAEAFLRGVRELLDSRTLAWYRAGALVKLASYLSRRRPRRWRERAHELLAEAESLLQGRR